MERENEFIPFEQALSLKELGFKEPCFGFYRKEKLYLCDYKNVNEEKISIISAPLYQQVFRFFREKYTLLSFVDIDSSYRIYCDDIKFDLDIDSRIFKTYEDAELECIKKLIEIAKEQNVK